MPIMATVIWDENGQIHEDVQHCDSVVEALDWVRNHAQVKTGPTTILITGAH
jgi:hypothetical protein